MNVAAHTRFRPEGWLDRVFEVGIILKGLNGLLEIVGGAVLLLVTPAQLDVLVQALTHDVRAVDPHAFIATHLLHATSGLTGSAMTFGGVYLLVHGVVKVVLVTAILLDRRWAYPWMIGVLTLFLGYELYRISQQPTVGLIVLAVSDLLILSLTIREWRIRRHGSDHGRAAP